MVKLGMDVKERLLIVIKFNVIVPVFRDFEAR
jgi:hypothetical protein